MRIKNVLQANDLDIKEFSIFFATIQLAMWGAILLDVVGIDIPIIREFFGFIYLTFIPGVLILRILKLHGLGDIQTFLYTVGLSLSTWMFIGLFINALYPLFGIKPFSEVALIFTVNVCILLLFIFCYLRDKDFSNPSYIDLKDLLSPPTLFLFLIPFLSVFGTYLVNYFHKNFLLLLMIVVIAFVSLLIGFDKYIPAKLYPLAIWSMAISLIWHNSLISSYVNVCDVVGEYAIADMIIKNSCWNYTLFETYNSVLSTVMLPPIYSLICGLDLTWIFKIIFTLLYSFVAIGAYFTFSVVTKSSKISYFSSLFIITIFPFFMDVASIPKQSIAEIFVVVLFMLMYSNMSKVKKALLSVVFSSSLVVSHYGTSFLFLFSIIFTYLYLSLLNNNYTGSFIRKIYFLITKEEWYIADSNQKKYKISPTLILFYLILVVSWYLYIANSVTFNEISYLFKFALNAVLNDFFDPFSSRGLHIITRQTSPLHSLSKYLYLMTQFLLVIGLFKELFNRRSNRFDDTYFGFSIYFLIILFFAIINSNFSAMDPRRLFHLSLFILAPFSIIGGLYILQLVMRSTCKYSDSKIAEKSSFLLSVFFAIFLLFNTGFIYEVLNDSHSSISICQESIARSDIEIKANFYGILIMPQNVFSGKWLTSNMVPGERIYRGDWVEGYPSLTIYGYLPEEALNTIYKPDGIYIKGFNNTSSNIGNGYIQLSYANVIQGIGSTWNNLIQERTAYNFSDVNYLLYDKNKIYNNGGSYILCKLD